jgi:antitoxin (DNA-binding transcriptional repressor) of toxin-antitoxin stability system
MSIDYPGREQRQRLAYRGMIMNVGAIHISEAEAARDFAGLLARVRAGAEIIIENGSSPAVVLRPAVEEFRPRLISESIALAKKRAEELGYVPRMDSGFAADLEEIVKNRRPWNPPAWE